MTHVPQRYWREERWSRDSFFLSFLFSVSLLLDDNGDFKSRLVGSRRRLCWLLSSTVDLVDVSIGFSLPLGGSLRRKRRILSLSVDLVEVTGDLSPSWWMSLKETAIALPIGGSRRGWKTVTCQSVAVFEEAKWLCLARGGSLRRRQTAIDSEGNPKRREVGTKPVSLSDKTITIAKLLVAFFMGKKSSAASAAWCAEACLHLSNLSFALCGSKPSSEKIRSPAMSSVSRGGLSEFIWPSVAVIGPVTPCSRSVTWFEFKYQGEWSDQSDNCYCFESQVYQKWSVISLSSSLVLISQSQIIKGHEDTMIGLHPGGRVTACSSKVIGSIMRTSDRPSRNIDRVISGYCSSDAEWSAPVMQSGEFLTCRRVSCTLLSREWKSVTSLSCFVCHEFVLVL
ncbi:hypothetical protein IGI04_003041 [Brassica rapa subsp. trilocularis]|uniref:Uncharacterized protein n=1 Tax=Brassica rapa subsp. trilocularis TaxID=1813537 RepID=A0ABQ7NX86_BRACM|nr:hypothetical protein IGI04_003041 [Brassica rapa subsp. trilocularis]